MARRALTGVLLVGGASTRFGSAKALAVLDGETLAGRVWATLGEACDERLAFAKTADAPPLPFPVRDDGTALRAPLAGIVAGLRAARHDVCVFVPVDCPLVPPELVRALGEAAAPVAVTQTGPLPAGVARSALPQLERRLQAGELRLRDVFAALGAVVVDADEALLANVNTEDDLRRLAAAASD